MIMASAVVGEFGAVQVGRVFRAASSASMAVIGG
jgi:hypothetical protein